MRIVEVLPQAVGWCVLGCGEPQYFRSGSWAERAARRIAQAIADGGVPVELRIADRSGRIAGRIRLGYCEAFAGLPQLEVA